MATHAASNPGGVTPAQRLAADGAVAWHAMAAAEVIARIGSTPDGLTPEEAARRLTEGGPNELRQAKQPGFAQVLLGQFKSFIVWLLIGAAAVSGLLGELVDFIAIAAIVVLNAFIGAWQEYSAERSIASRFHR